MHKRSLTRRESAGRGAGRGIPSPEVKEGAIGGAYMAPLKIINVGSIGSIKILII